MAPPSRQHQEISIEVSGAIKDYIRSHKGTCKVYTAPFAVYLDESTNTYVEPDISVICDKNKLNDEGCKGAPDWIIEIVSPGSRRMDYYTKLFKYRTAGVKEYWIVDQSKNRITVYSFVESSMNEFSFSNCVKVGIFEDLSIDFSQIDLT